MPRKKDHKDWDGDSVAVDDPVELEARAQREFALRQMKQEEALFDEAKDSLQRAAPKYAKWIENAVDDEEVDAKTKAFVAGMVFDRTGHAATRKVETVERTKKDNFESTRLVGEVAKQFLGLPADMLRVLMEEIKRARPEVFEERPALKMIEDRRTIEAAAFEEETPSQMLKRYTYVIDANTPPPPKEEDEDGE
jgi:hypothetical protein